MSGREAGDAQDDQPGGKTGARQPQPADQIRTRETAEIAEGIDEADGAGRGRGRAGEEVRGYRPEWRRAPKQCSARLLGTSNKK